MSRSRIASAMTVEVRGAIMATSPRVKSEQATGERELAGILGEAEAEDLFSNRRKRDGDKAHITLANPADAKKAVANLAAQKGVSKGEAERQLKELSLAGALDNFRVKGIGKAESGGKIAYFLVVDWPGGREFREAIGLDAGGQDFHITLGFGPEGDVHGVPKNRVIQASKLPMKQASLRSKLIRLANARPELRGELLPLLRVATEFSSEEALKKYLEEHPNADPKNHTVKKAPEKDESDKGKGYESDPKVQKASKKREEAEKELKRFDEIISRNKAELKELTPKFETLKQLARGDNPEHRNYLTDDGDTKGLEEFLNDYAYTRTLKDTFSGADELSDYLHLRADVATPSGGERAVLVDKLSKATREEGEAIEAYEKAAKSTPKKEEANETSDKKAALRARVIRLAYARPYLRRALLPILKQAATGDAVFDVKQELRGGHDLIEDGNYFDYEYVNLASEAVKDVIRRLQGAGFLDFSMDEDGVLMATRPGGIKAEVEFDSWEESGHPWTEVAVEVTDLSEEGSKMASLRTKLIRLAHSRPDLRPTLLPLLAPTATREAAYGFGPMPRSSYIPKDEPTLARVPGLPEGLEVYTYHRPDSRGQIAYYGVAFAGRAQKPLWQYRFRDEAQRDRQIAETVKSVESQLKAKQQRSEERKQFTHGLQVGDILYSSWGYDQTNINWYEVVGVPTEKMILVREIAGRTLRSDGYGSDEVIPASGKYIGPVMKKIPTGRAGHISVKINSVQTAWKWDGKPQRETSSGWGH